MVEVSTLEVKKILVPVDFSGRSSAAAEHAVVMAVHFHLIDGPHWLNEAYSDTTSNLASSPVMKMDQPG